MTSPFPLNGWASPKDVMTIYGGEAEQDWGEGAFIDSTASSVIIAKGSDDFAISGSYDMGPQFSPEEIDVSVGVRVMNAPTGEISKPLWTYFGADYNVNPPTSILSFRWRITNWSSVTFDINVRKDTEFKSVWYYVWINDATPSGGGIDGAENEYWNGPQRVADYPTGTPRHRRRYRKPRKLIRSIPMIIDELQQGPGTSRRGAIRAQIPGGDSDPDE